jgi:beta-galactosidase
VAAGETVAVPLPPGADTVTATTADGLTVGVGQAPVPESPPVAGRAAGPVRLDPVNGRLLGIGDLEIAGPVLHVWRAPIDNDRLDRGGLLDSWRKAGLHRMQHRLIAIEPDDAGALVVSRLAAAGTDLGLRVEMRWTGGDVLTADVRVVPEGEWTVSLPRLGLRMSLPPGLDRVSWYGRGPGEAYPDSYAAALFGRYTATVDELPTPYVYPQENGHRADVTWLELRDPAGRGLRVTGEPTFGFTARRCTDEDLDVAAHITDIPVRDRIHLTVDHRQRGLGSAACGPRPLPGNEVPVREYAFRLTLAALGE